MTELLLFLGVAVVVGILAIWFASDLLALIHRPANWLLRVVGWQEAPVETKGLNSPSQRMIGQRGVLLCEFVNGRSRAKIGYSEWSVELGDGSKVPDVGEAVEVRSVKNGLLLVGSVEDENA